MQIDNFLDKLLNRIVQVIVLFAKFKSWHFFKAVILKFFASHRL